MGSNLLPRPARPATHKGGITPLRVATYALRVATRVQVGVQLWITDSRLNKAKKGVLGSKGSNLYKNFSVWSEIEAYRETIGASCYTCYLDRWLRVAESAWPEWRAA